ncbi:MAG: DUF2914 domain-containing protein [Nannocystaceae bacterium]
MTGASDDARPPDDERAAVDSDRDAIADEVEDASREAPATDESSADAEASESASHRAISGPHSAVGKDLLAEPEQEMDRLMHGTPPSLPTTSSNDGEPEPEPEPEPDERAPATEPEPKQRPSLEVLEGGGETRPEPVPQPRASRPVETAAPAAQAPGGGMPWAWVGIGALAVGAIAYFGLRDRGPAKPRARTAATATDPTATPSTIDRDLPLDPSVSTTTTGEGGSEDGPDARDPDTSRRGSDPRVPPPGTSPEAAEVFTRLPVSPSDQPPVGGVGASGIHIDHIALGSAQSDDGSCQGNADDFSVERRDLVTVCVRVVHQREKEELQVLWEKRGGATRRSKMVVQPRHAYRTRGYLKLRKEYIGDWTVRILSSDDVELARHDFTVVP